MLMIELIPMRIVFLCLYFLVIFIPNLHAGFTNEFLQTLRRLIQSDCHCSPSHCCSKWGYCGKSDAYCGEGCQSGPCKHLVNKHSHPSLITTNTFDCIFPHRDSQHGRRRYHALVDAINTSKWKLNNRVEMAIFLAHISYTTKGLTTLVETCSTPSDCDQYQTSWCSIEPQPGKKYHGRGMLSLSYPCNYYYAGQALGLDLLSDPDVVGQSEKVAALTAMWYFNHSGMRELAQRGDFGGTVQRINRNHCSNPLEYQKLISYGKIYHKVRQCFALPEITINLTC